MMVIPHKSTATRYSYLEVYDYPRQAISPVRVCVMEVFIPNCLGNDILVVNGEVEVTNDLPYAVEVCRRVSLETSTGGILGPIITPEAGENVTPQMWENSIFPGQHHMLIPFSGLYVVTNPGNYFVSLVMYAGGSSYTQLGDRLNIEQSTNHINVLRFTS